MAQVLLSRPDDHLVLGIDWVGLRLVRRPGGKAPALVAEASGGLLELTFPPQHLGEHAFADGEDVSRPRESRLSGPSVLRFKIPDGEEIELTCEGLLKATIDRPIDASSVIELPWRLRMRPEVGSDGSPTAAHPVTVAPSGQTNPLWRTRLRPADLVGADRAAADVDVQFNLPLARSQRVDIYEWTNAALGGSPVHAERLELGTLGGTLAASGRWAQFEWGHSRFSAATCGSARSPEDFCTRSDIVPNTRSGSSEKSTPRRISPCYVPTIN